VCTGRACDVAQTTHAVERRCHLLIRRRGSVDKRRGYHRRAPYKLLMQSTAHFYSTVGADVTLKNNSSIVIEIASFSAVGRQQNLIGR